MPRATTVVGIFPNEAALRQLIGAALLEQNDEWAVQHAPYMPCDTMAELLDPPLGRAGRHGTLIHAAQSGPTVTG